MRKSNAADVTLGTVPRAAWTGVGCDVRHGAQNGVDWRRTVRRPCPHCGKPGITSNLVFSQWDQIFQNPMATAAAIDRVVHHSVILEFDVPSYRTREAQGRQQNATDNYQQEEKRQK